jgi:hypothetical protein
MRSFAWIMASTFLLVALLAGASLAEYHCEYSNSEGSGNDATNRCVGIAVLSEDNFVLSISRPDQMYYALCKWTDCTYSTGRGNDVLQWYYQFDTVNLEEVFGLAADDNGYLYVVNNDQSRNILVFDANGADPVANAYRLETTTDDTLYAIDVDSEGHVFVCYANADQDRVDIYPSITDDMWTTHTGSPIASVSLPDGLYYGMCVNSTGTEVYVSEYNSATINRYTGSVASGFTHDAGFSVQLDSVATAVDVDNQGYLYVVSDHWRERSYVYSKFWVVNLASGVITDKIDMYWAGGGDIYGASDTSAGYYSAIDIEVDQAGNVYVLHDYAWAVEKWVGSPSTAVETSHHTSHMPQELVLSQNYPNPFNAATEIRYDLPEPSHVSLEIFNVTGQRVAILVNREQPAGRHFIQWDAGNLPSGIYLVRLQTGQQMATRKMVLVR